MQTQTHTFGIPGLDDCLSRGIPQGYSVVISGGPGTGKTMFGLSFLIKGNQGSQPVLYISLIEKQARLKARSDQFMIGNLEAHHIHYVDLDACNYCYDITSDTELKELIEGRKIERIVIDSFNSLYEYHPLPVEVKPSQKPGEVGLEDVVEGTRTIGTRPEFMRMVFRKLIHFLNQFDPVPTTLILFENTTALADNPLIYEADGLFVLTQGDAESIIHNIHSEDVTRSRDAPARRQREFYLIKLRDMDINISGYIKVPFEIKTQGSDRIVIEFGPTP